MKFVIGRTLTILSWDDPVTAFFRINKKLRYSLGMPSRSDFVQFEVKTPDVTVQVNPARSDLVETKVIDGRPCLVIAINDAVHVNGIPVRVPLPEANSNHSYGDPMDMAAAAEVPFEED